LIFELRFLSKFAISFVTTCVLVVGFNKAYGIEIRIPVTSGDTTRQSYQIGLLKVLLKKIPGQHTITISTTNYTQSRIIHQLKSKDKLINLYWAGTSSELEQQLLPIYIPLYRGLLGYRSFIINNENKKIFSSINTLKDLQALNGVQGLGWADTKLLEYSGLKQYSAKYENCFSMINKGRVDYFSRGIMEAGIEVKARVTKLPHLSLDENVLLHYPFAMYFFTGPDNKQLAKALTKAFKRAYEDGSFLQYFNSRLEIKKALEQLNDKNRKRINIPNPFLTDKTMNISEEYWLKP